jgi:hypothetical protein
VSRRQDSPCIHLRCLLNRRLFIPRSSRRRSPEAPDRTREAPVTRGRKTLLTARIPAHSGSGRKRHDRPVTRRSRVRVPSLPSLKVPATWGSMLSGQARPVAPWPNVARCPNSKVPANRDFEGELVARSHEQKQVIASEDVDVPDSRYGVGMEFVMRGAAVVRQLWRRAWSSASTISRERSVARSFRSLAPRRSRSRCSSSR